MNCFEHREAPALGICKTCGKGVCPACARSAEGAILCSEACEREHRLIREMNQKALKIYGIGSPQKGLPNSVIAPLLMGLAFVLGTLLMGFTTPDALPLTLFFGLMAGVMLLGAFIAYRKFRDNGINV